MFKFMTFILLITLSAQSFSQTCAQKLQLTKKTSYINRLSDDTRQVVGFVSTVGGLAVGLTVASSALPAFLIAAGVASTPILAGEGIRAIQNRPINRMIRLIKQSETLVGNPEKTPGRLLRKLHKKLSLESAQISILELATSIANANKDPKLCGQINRLKDIKEEIETGRLPVVELDEDSSEE
jgi:hypothetical protein